MRSIVSNKIESVDKLLRRLSKDNFFGEEAKRLNSIREGVNTTIFIYESALSIVNTNYGNNKMIYQVCNLLLLIYADATKINSQQLNDILVSFVEGTVKDPDSENLTSYKNYIIENTKLANSIKELTLRGSITYVDRMTLGNDIAAHYSSAVEMVAKILVPLIQIDKLIGRKSFSPMKIEKMSTAAKLNTLRQSKHCDWDFIVQLINKNIRNAESHLNFSYNPELGKFDGKYFDGKSEKYVDISISTEEFVVQILKGVETVILGYFLSNCMLYLSTEDKDKAKKIADIMGREF